MQKIVALRVFQPTALRVRRSEMDTSDSLASWSVRISISIDSVPSLIAQAEAASSPQRSPKTGQ
jgi:hypothetical protein